MLTRNLRAILILVVLALVASSCGGSSTANSSNPASTTTTANHDDDESDEHGGEFDFGEPADAADASRVIEITANDDFSFDPSEVTVSSGEIVTFRITNAGVVPHDFTLGDQATQDVHEAEMVEMMESGQMSMHDEVNAVVLAAGETKEITWHFSEAMNILMGCHQAGHYASGMKGTISVGS